jgi:hypothetical protein
MNYFGIVFEGLLSKKRKFAFLRGFLMGVNQFFLLAMCMIIVGASIRVGNNLFQANSIEQDKKSLINDIRSITINALQYKTKTANLGGGKGSYVGYAIPKQLLSNSDGTFKVTVTASQITVTATSGAGNGTVASAFDQNGKFVAKTLTYTGNFK